MSLGPLRKVLSIERSNFTMGSGPCYQLECGHRMMVSRTDMSVARTPKGLPKAKRCNKCLSENKKGNNQ